MRTFDCSICNIEMDKVSNDDVLSEGLEYTSIVVFDCKECDARLIIPVQVFEVPQPLEQPDFTKLITLGKEYINAINNEDRFKDPEYWLYEQALFCIFGEDIFEWINKRR